MTKLLYNLHSLTGKCADCPKLVSSLSLERGDLICWFSHENARISLLCVKMVPPTNLKFTLNYK